MLLRSRTDHVATFIEDEYASSASSNIDSEKMNMGLRKFSFEVVRSVESTLLRAFLSSDSTGLHATNQVRRLVDSRITSSGSIAI